jgi:hypothetical protein
MPIDRGLIDQQLQALGESSQWWDCRELRDLPAVMDADERILAISHGKLGRARWLRRSWLMVVTGRRLLFIRSSGRTSWRQLEIGANQIVRVALRVGLIRGRVIVTVAGRSYRLLVPRMDAYKLVSALSSLGTPGPEAFLGYTPARMVRRVVDHVLALPAAALNPEPARPAPPPIDHAADQRLQSLEEEVQELRQQVEFLEQLIRQRQPSITPETIPYD